MDDNLAKALMWDGVRCVISIFVVHAWSWRLHWISVQTRWCLDR
ncbi:hypothetical protein [Nonomuraea bangladeshensis]